MLAQATAPSSLKPVGLSKGQPVDLELVFAMLGDEGLIDRFDRRGLLKALGALGVSSALAGCTDMVPRQYRYRLAYELNDNGRKVTASAINQVEWVRFLMPGMSGGHSSHGVVNGEAVLFNLGPRRILVSTLNAWGGLMPNGKHQISMSPPWDPMGFLMDGLRLTSKDSDVEMANIEKLNGLKTSPVVELDITDMTMLPVFVTFDDPLQPATVRDVDSTDLSSTFSPGVRLTRATVQIVDAPLYTEGLEKALPWIPAVIATGAGLRGELTRNEKFDPVVVESASVRLHGNAFIRRERP